MRHAISRKSRARRHMSFIGTAKLIFCIRNLLIRQRFFIQTSAGDAMDQSYSRTLLKTLGCELRAHCLPLPTPGDMKLCLEQIRRTELEHAASEIVASRRTRRAMIAPREENAAADAPAGQARIRSRASS
jgi:hypothetical protein